MEARTIGNKKASGVAIILISAVLISTIFMVYSGIGTSRYIFNQQNRLKQALTLASNAALHCIDLTNEDNIARLAKALDSDRSNRYLTLDNSLAVETFTNVLKSNLYGDNTELAGFVVIIIEPTDLDNRYNIHSYGLQTGTHSPVTHSNITKQDLDYTIGMGVNQALPSDITIDNIEIRSAIEEELEDLDSSIVVSVIVDYDLKSFMRPNTEVFNSVSVHSGSNIRGYYDGGYKRIR